MLRRIFARRSDEAWGGGWRKLHDLYSPNTIREIKSRRTRWAGHVARMGERCVQGFGGGKTEGRRTLWRPRRRWEDNIKMDLKEVGCGVRTGSSWLRIRTGDGHA